MRIESFWESLVFHSVDDEDRAGQKEVLARCPELDAAAGHIRAFGEILSGRLGAKLPAWIDALDTSQLPGLTGFASTSSETSTP